MIGICESLLLAAQNIRLERLLPVLFTCVAIGATVLAVVAYAVQSVLRYKRQKQIDKQHQLQYRQWHKLISMNGELTPLETPLMLSKGEVCLWFEEHVTLMEVKAISHSNHSFGSMPMGDTEIHFGKAYGTSETTDEWRPISEGQLYITNKKIYFDGDKQDRKISFSELSTVKANWSAIDISSTTRPKSMIFCGVNGKICQEVIHLIHNEAEQT